MAESAIDLLPKRDGFYYEALRICHERDLPDTALPNLEAGLRHRSFMRAIQPFLRASVEAFDVRPMTIGPNGVIRLGDLSEDQRKTLALLNELIISAAQQHGLHYCPLPTQEG